jgi:hypothetical protein
LPNLALGVPKQTELPLQHSRQTAALPIAPNSLPQHKCKFVPEGPKNRALTLPPEKRTARVLVIGPNEGWTMKRKFSDEQIIGMLRKYEAGAKAQDTLHPTGFAQPVLTTTRSTERNKNGFYT